MRPRGNRGTALHPKTAPTGGRRMSRPHPLAHPALQPIPGHHPADVGCRGEKGPQATRLPTASCIAALARSSERSDAGGVEAGSKHEARPCAVTRLSIAHAHVTCCLYAAKLVATTDPRTRGLPRETQEPRRDCRASRALGGAQLTDVSTCCGEAGGPARDSAAVPLGTSEDCLSEGPPAFPQHASPTSSRRAPEGPARSPSSAAVSCSEPTDDLRHRRQKPVLRLRR